MRAGCSSVRLYSRGDIWGALQLQRQVVKALTDGWRPLTAQQRGALPPRQELQVELRPWQPPPEAKVYVNFRGFQILSVK